MPFHLLRLQCGQYRYYFAIVYISIVPRLEGCTVAKLLPWEGYQYIALLAMHASKIHAHQIEKLHFHAHQSHRGTMLSNSFVSVKLFGLAG